MLEGSGPAGATLRLTKAFKTETFPQPPDDQPLLVDDKLETVYDIGDDGRVRWHVNPSTRPIVAKETGVPDAGAPSPAQSQTGGVAGSSPTEDDPDDGAAVPAGDANSNDTVSYNDHPITVPATGDNASMSVRVSWTSLAGDWDIKLYEDTNGNGKSENDEPVVGTSQTGPSNIEEVSANGTPRLTGGKKYVLRVNNFAATAADNYDVDITFEAPPPFKPAQVESYTLTCEQGGKVLDTQQVQIDRGQVKALDLSVCTAASACLTAKNGTRGRDALVGTAAGDRLRGLRGADRATGLGGDDCVLGNKGRDRLRGDSGDDQLGGGNGRDRLVGGPGADSIKGGAGPDNIDSRDGDVDRVECGSGVDRVRADRADELKGCERVRLSAASAD